MRKYRIVCRVYGDGSCTYTPQYKVRFWPFWLHFTDNYPQCPEVFNQLHEAREFVMLEINRERSHTLVSTYIEMCAKE